MDSIGSMSASASVLFTHCSYEMHYLVIDKWRIEHEKEGRMVVGSPSALHVTNDN